MLPCSTSPAVVPAAAATAAAAAVTEAGAVVCLLPTAKSPIPSHTRRKRVTRQGGKEGERERCMGNKGVKIEIKGGVTFRKKGKRTGREGRG